MHHLKPRGRFGRRAAATVAAVACFTAIAVGCSSDDATAPQTDTTAPLETTSFQPPEGTTVDVSTVALVEPPAGNGEVHSSAAASGDGDVPQTLADDYREVEYVFSGEAATYSGPVTGPAVEDSTGNAYATRLIARFPKDESQFSGRVFVEPFNTTAGPDRDVIWRQTAPFFQEEGDAWVGISVRTTSGTMLQEFDAERYAGLSIPTNDVEWDMLRQLGAVLRLGGEQSPIPQPAEHLYMGGYSQSGVDTATFAMAFHDETELLDGDPVFDGYLPAAHAATMTPLQTGSGIVIAFENVPMEPVDVPVVDFETQHDAQGWTREVLPDVEYTSLGGASVRRPDADSETDKYRLLELTGASHSSGSADCGGPPSTFPLTPFVRGAVAQLYRWAELGEAPTEADPIEMEAIEMVSTPVVDDVGNALGGVRSPWVDVPLVNYQVVAGGTGLACAFTGTEEPLPPEELEARYGDVETYLDQFTESLDETIEAGYLLEMDRAELIDDATEKAEELLAPAG